MIWALGVLGVAMVLTPSTLTTNGTQQVHGLVTGQVVLDLEGATLGYPFKTWWERVVRSDFGRDAALFEPLLIV